MTPPPYWPQATQTLATRDAVMKRLITAYPGETLTSRGDAFFTLARSIVGQQISVKAADSVWKRVMLACEAFPRQPGRHGMMEIADETLRACGLSGQKVAYMRALCAYFSAAREFAHLSDDEVIAELTQIKGIGRWTADMFLMFHLLRPDVLPLADIGLQKAMFNHYFNGQKVPLSALKAHAEQWQPYRSVATWYLWRSLDPVPVEY